MIATTRQLIACSALTVAGLTVCALACAASAFDRASSAEKDISAAIAALDARLRQQHPSVRRIVIEPLVERYSKPGAPGSTLQPNSAIEDISVLHVGARSAVRVAVRGDNGMRTQVLWFDVKAYLNVATATRNLRPLDRLVEADATVAERDVLATGCSPVSSTTDLNEMRIKRALHEGELICGEFLEPRPAVARGDAVTVRYMAERIELTGKGIARHDAAVGQRLALINPETKEAFSGVVAADGEVKIHAR